MKALVKSTIVLSLAVLTGCDLPGRPDPADRPVPADQVMDFGILYGQNCAGCHGADGTLGPAPPLNDPFFRAIVPEGGLKDIISGGRTGTLMPAFAQDNGGILTAAQIQVLVKEVKGVRYRIVSKTRQGGDQNTDGSAGGDIVADASGITPRWGTTPTPPAGVPQYRDDSAGKGNSDRGSVVFGRACADCHGNRGQGVTSDGKTFCTINDRVFLALISDQALRRFIITGRPDLGMPGFNTRPGDPHFSPLSGQDVADLTALLASWREEK